MDPTQRAQHHEYDFPYHYIPQVTEKGFRGFRSWGWSLNYVCALNLVRRRLSALGTKSHIDIGCGDGALLSYLSLTLTDAVMVGVDYDEQAIALARLMSPGMDYRSGDITAMDFPAKFQTGSLVEVLEHIPPGAMPTFLAAVKQVIRENGTLLATVPHVNKPLIEKHYRHFSFDSFREMVSEHFEVVEIFGFERPKTLLQRFRSRLDNRLFFMDIPKLNERVLQNQLAFRSSGEDQCMRIFAEMHPRPSA